MYFYVCVMKDNIVCMCVFVCMCVCVCVCVYWGEPQQVYSQPLFMCVRACAHVLMSVCVYVCVCVCNHSKFIASLSILVR